MLITCSTPIIGKFLQIYRRKQDIIVQFANQDIWYQEWVVSQYHHVKLKKHTINTNKNVRIAQIIV